MVKLTDKVVPDAYHGTSRVNAVSIIRTKKFEPSSGENCFLGDGIYFFESGKEHAKWWARKQYPGTGIAVILAVVRLGRCLDLGDPDHIALIRLTKEEIEKKGGTKNLTDTAILNFLTSKIDKEIETVRGYFHGSHFRLFVESKIFEITHVIICVKKHENIVDFRLL
jgi:hypothetical protein